MGARIGVPDLAGGVGMSAGATRGPRLSAEPFVWLGFSAGGVAAALILPALLFLFGVAFPLGWIDTPDRAHLLAVAGHPLSRLALLGTCAFSLIHFAHRFRFTLIDGLQLRRYDRLIATGCYGLAGVGAALAAWIFLFAL
jgi:fumarate reductase subunit D